MPTPDPVRLRRGSQSRYLRNKPTTWTPVSVASYGPSNSSTSLTLTCRRGDQFLQIDLPPAVRAAIRELDRQFQETPVRTSAIVDVATFAA